MRLPFFKFYTNDKPETWLKNVLNPLLKSLSVGLRTISFKDNFESFVEEVEIPAFPAVDEVIVTNKLKTIPSHMIVTRQRGGGLITEGVAQWTRESLSLRNLGTVTARATIVFMR